MSSRKCDFYTEADFCRSVGSYLVIHWDGQVIQMADPTIFSYFMNNEVRVSDGKKTQTFRVLPFCLLLILGKTLSIASLTIVQNKGLLKKVSVQSHKSDSFWFLNEF